MNFKTLLKRYINIILSFPPLTYENLIKPFPLLCENKSKILFEIFFLKSDIALIENKINESVSTLAVIKDFIKWSKSNLNEGIHREFRHENKSKRGKKLCWGSLSFQNLKK